VSSWKAIKPRLHPARCKKPRWAGETANQVQLTKRSTQIPQYYVRIGGNAASCQAQNPARFLYVEQTGQMQQDFQSCSDFDDEHSEEDKGIHRDSSNCILHRDLTKSRACCCLSSIQMLLEMKSRMKILERTVCVAFSSDFFPPPLSLSLSLSSVSFVGSRFDAWK